MLVKSSFINRLSRLSWLRLRNVWGCIYRTPAGQTLGLRASDRQIDDGLTRFPRSMMGSPGFPAVRPKATGCRALASHGALQRDWKIFTVSLHLIGFDRVQYPSHVVHGFPWFLLKLRFCGYPGYPPFFRHIRCTPQSCWSSSSARQMFHSLRRWDSEISCVVRTESCFGRYSMCVYNI